MSEDTSPPKDPHNMADDPTVEVMNEVGGEPDYKDLWLRTQAELDNTRKRYETERGNLIKFSQAGLLEELLPVVDNFYRATSHVPEEQTKSPWVAGIQYIQKNLLDVLASHGVREMTLKVGDRFNATQHEAIGTVVSEDIPDDHIAEIAASGYLLHERVLRPARVIVAHPAPDKEEGAEKSS